MQTAVLDLMSRRRFLTTTVAGGVALAAIPVLADPPARIAFGFSLYGMKSLTTSQALKICAEIGYSGVELVCLKDWPCEAAVLKKADRNAIRSELKDLSLDLPALMENLALVGTDEQHKTNLERLKNVCGLAHELSPDGPPAIVETVLGGKPEDWPAVRERMVDRLRSWEKVAAAQSTVVAIKAHAFGALHTPQDALAIVQQIDSRWLRLVYDFSHFQRRQFRLDESLASLLPHTVFVHIKDNVTKDGKTEFALPGDAGDIDYVKYLSQLRDGRYRGAVMVEVSAQVSGKPEYDPIAAAKRCYQNIQPAFIKAGLRLET